MYKEKEREIVLLIYCTYLGLIIIMVTCLEREGAKEIVGYCTYAPVSCVER